MHKKNDKKYLTHEQVVEKIFNDYARGEGAFSDDTRAMFERWLIDNELTEEHREVVSRFFGRDVVSAATPSRESLQILARLKRQLGMEDAATTPLRRRSALRRFVPRVAAAVAALVLVSGLGYVAFRHYTPQGDEARTVAQSVAQLPASGITSEAIEGVQKEIVLGDSTKVWVNSGSKVVYPDTFADNQRDVYLEGEAYFDVSRDETKPFVVHTSKLDVRVLGTEFNVEEKPQSTLVTLHSGSVEVVAGERGMKLSPNQRLTYAHDSGEMTVESLAVVEDWRSDEIYTTDRTLPQLFRMIGNYYDVEIVFDEADFASPANTYNSAFGKGQTAEGMIRNLAVLTGRFSYRAEDGRIYIERE